MATQVTDNVGLYVCSEKKDDSECQYLGYGGSGCYYDIQLDKNKSCWSICNNRKNILQCQNYCADYFRKYCTSEQDHSSTTTVTPSSADGQKIGYGVGFGGGALLLILIAVLVWKRSWLKKICRKDKSRGAVNKEDVEQNGHQMKTATRTSLQDVAVSPEEGQKMMFPTEHPTQEDFVQHPDEQGSRAQQPPNPMDQTSQPGHNADESNAGGLDASATLANGRLTGAAN